MIQVPESAPRFPNHVAMIMDGNGRWAKSRGLKRLDGHKAGAKSVQLVVECCRRWNIPYLTLFSFSTENWLRSSEEVSGLMSLFKTFLDNELEKLLQNDIRLIAIGDLDKLPKTVRKSLDRNIKQTECNKSLQLILALSSGGREDIINAAKKIAIQAQRGEILPDQIDAVIFSSHLWTRNIPDPDVLIRTSGEMRISNFLLWQLAYTEIIITNKLWPDFSEADFRECLEEYGRRERRFGRTSEQIISSN